MKKLFILSLLLCFPLVFSTCNKDPETPTANMEVIEEEPTFTIEDEMVSVFFSGEVNYPGKIKDIILKTGTSSNWSDAKEYAMQLDDHSFSLSIPDLLPSKTYYYRYYIDYGFSEDYAYKASAIKTPALPAANLPTVSTEEITSLGVKGNVTSDGGARITERGICWGLEQSPNISGNHLASGEGTGEFTVELLNLEAGIYYVRAYATNRKGTAYGKVLMLVAKGDVKHDRAIMQ